MLVILGFKNFDPTHGTDAFFISALLTIMRADLMYFGTTNFALFEFLFVGIEAAFLGGQKLIFVNFSAAGF